MIRWIVCCAALCVWACGPVDSDTDDATPSGALPALRWRVAFDAEPYGAFMSVWGPSETEVYTVGGQPDFGASDGHGVAMRYDGATWSEIDLSEGGMLNWVHGAGGAVFFVGEQGRVVHRAAGQTISDVSIGTDAPLWGVWAAAPDDVWAVGGNARDRAALPILAHWDGAAWTILPAPEVDRPGFNALFKVWGTASGDVWAIGVAGVILHFDGAAWVQVPSGTGDDLVSLWGRTPDDVVAVGGRGNGTLGRWDGSAWLFQRLDRVPGLNGSWMAPDGTVLAGGLSSEVLRIDSGYTAVAMETPMVRVIHGVFGFQSGPCFAVGGSLISNPPYVGDVLIGEAQ